MDELAFYRRVCDAVCASDLEALVARALDAAIALSGAESGHLVLAAEPGRPLRVELSRGGAPDPALSSGIIGAALAARRTVRIENALDDPSVRDLESVRRLHILSVLAAPIVHEGRPLAALWLASTRLAGIFSREAEEVVTAFAERIAPALAASLAAREVRRSRDALLDRLAETEGFSGLVGAHPSFTQLLEDTARVAPTDVPVLILGESGTGKELLARAIHQRSGRRARPLVALNCGAIPEPLLESELFGHEKGAFTGAAARAGKFAAADGGTILLDEIGELPVACQVRLLRVLQSGEVQRLGSDAPTFVDVRVVAATNRPLRKLAQEGGFREDLFYRLSGVTLHVPPLRARGEDVLLLAGHILRREARALARSVPVLDDEAKRALLAHPFPGNVRELENALRHALIFARGDRIGPGDLPPELRSPPAPPASAAQGVPASSAPPTTRAELEERRRAATTALERAFVEHVLEKAVGNVAEAARLADMNRSSLHELLRKVGIEAHRFRG